MTKLYVVFMLLVLSSAQALAAPRAGQSARAARSCARSLVSDDLEERVNARAQELAEWAGEADRLNRTLSAQKIADLRELVQQVRASYSVSVEQTRALLERLDTEIAAQRVEILVDLGLHADPAELARLAAPVKQPLSAESSGLEGVLVEPKGFGPPPTGFGP